jgi:maltooligosyltrehalose trehalohydrolase
MVFLDVVYNHFGPEGNYLGCYAPAFFTAGADAVGLAIDYRVPEYAPLPSATRCIG